MSLIPGSGISVCCRHGQKINKAGELGGGVNNLETYSSCKVELFSLKKKNVDRIQDNLQKYGKGTAFESFRV